ncbi:hypothetical protein B0H11DRAFT_2251143 [Mycena galericulata]|nr:hypothetical protein B0H11DRAFT_2251143 [Mycena galericulata]
MKADETFDEWTTNLQSLAALLADDDSADAGFALDDKRLRHTIEAGMLPDLNRRYTRHATAPKIADDKFDDWLKAVIEIDEVRLYDDERIATLLAEKAEKERSNGGGKRKAPSSTVDDADHAPKKPFGDSRKGNTAASSSTTATFVNCPPLTADERELLRANDGCNKCRRFFVGHQSKSCPNGFPDPANYQTLTQADANRAKTTSKGKAVAVVMPAIDDVDDSEDDDELSSVSSDSFPFRVPHLEWNCLIEGPMSNFPLPIKVLIDDGAHLVLIDSDLVDKLELRRFKLHRPEPISLAMAADSDPITHLKEYVKLKLLSVDQSWTSRTIRALVAPNLCSPVILGLPWLARNSIVVDHAERTAVDKNCGYDILNPPPPSPPKKKVMKLREKLKRTKADHKAVARELFTVCEKRRLDMEAKSLFEPVKEVDVIAAIRERVEVLAHWDELNKRGDKIREEFPVLFEPMPHVDMLPTDVYCEITALCGT